VSLEGVVFFERSVIKQKFKTLSSREFIASMMLVDTSLASTKFGLLFQAFPSLYKRGALGRKSGLLEANKTI
jgi:hypothetical protein